MNKRLRVGITGAGTDPRWASISHVPAVQTLAGFELAAVVTKDQSSARAVAKLFGIKKAYGDAKDLFKDPDIAVWGCVSEAVAVEPRRTRACEFDCGLLLCKVSPRDSDTPVSPEVIQNVERSGRFVYSKL